jgi:hypothetical protein
MIEVDANGHFADTSVLHQGWSLDPVPTALPLHRYKKGVFMLKTMFGIFMGRGHVEGICVYANVDAQGKVLDLVKLARMGISSVVGPWEPGKYRGTWACAPGQLSTCYFITD